MLSILEKLRSAVSAASVTTVRWLTGYRACTGWSEFAASGHCTRNETAVDQFTAPTLSCTAPRPTATLNRITAPVGA